MVTAMRIVACGLLPAQHYGSRVTDEGSDLQFVSSYPALAPIGVLRILDPGNSSEVVPEPVRISEAATHDSGCVTSTVGAAERRGPVGRPGLRRRWCFRLRGPGSDLGRRRSRDDAAGCDQWPTLSVDCDSPRLQQGNCPARCRYRDVTSPPDPRRSAMPPRGEVCRSRCSRQRTSDSLVGVLRLAPCALDQIDRRRTGGHPGSKPGGSTLVRFGHPCGVRPQSCCSAPAMAEPSSDGSGVNACDDQFGRRVVPELVERGVYPSSCHPVVPLGHAVRVANVDPSASPPNT